MLQSWAQYSSIEDEILSTNLETQTVLPLNTIYAIRKILQFDAVGISTDERKVQDDLLRIIRESWFDERQDVEGGESVFSIKLNAYFIVVLKMATIKYLQHNLHILSGEPMFSKTMLSQLAKCDVDNKDELALIIGEVLIPIMNMEYFLYGITIQKKTLDQTLSDIREKREKQGRGTQGL